MALTVAAVNCVMAMCASQEGGQHMKPWLAQ